MTPHVSARRSVAAFQADRPLPHGLHVVHWDSYGEGVDENQASAGRWRGFVRSRGSIEQDRETLARLIEYDSDPFEVELYEYSSDPLIRLVDKAQRSYAGQYDRRLRRLGERARRRSAVQ
jgi:hypothetical protein